MTQPEIRQHPPEWVRHLSKPDLRDLFGELALHRGTAYQRQGSVVALAFRADGRTLAANVQGTRRYTTLVTLRELSPSPLKTAQHVDVLSTCSCPLGGDCKHAVAVILHAQQQLPDTPVTPTASAWESLLAPLVRDVTASVQAHTPLALLVEVNPGSSAYRQRPYLNLRPLVRGASGAWIRSGISWSELQYAHEWRDFAPAQQEALAAIITAANARTPYYYGNGQSVSTERLGPTVWRLLQEALAAGVTLVTGSKADRPVVLLPEPAELVLDTTRESSAGDIVVRPRIRVSGAQGQATTLGSPAHGVYIKEDNRLTLAPLSEPLSAKLFELLESVDSLTVPARDADRFLTHYYPALRQQANVESSDDSVTFPEVLPPRLGLRVTFADGHRTLLRWSFHYTVGTETISVPLLRSATADPVARDAAAEEDLLSSLGILHSVDGLTTPLPGKTRPGVVLEPTLQDWSTIAFLRDVLPVLQARDDIDITVVGSPLDYLEVDSAPVVSVATRDIADAGSPDHEDWFDLEIVVTVADRAVPLVTLLSALALGEERLLLDDGAWFSLDRPELQTLRRIVHEARALQDREPDQLRINRYQAGLWEELVDLGVVAEQSQRWSSSVGALLALDEVPHPQPPPSLTATLRPYQLDGYQWLSFLWDHHLGGILADDMGLGKTLQMLSTAERARLDGCLTPDAPMLVVAPTSVVSTWHGEAETFTPEMTVATITQTSRKSGVPLREATAGAHVVVTSYALLRLDAESYSDIQWSALVLDEAQFVKNHQSRTHQVARSLRAPVKFAITGTPLENSLMDLWALLSITAPGLFPSPQRFGELFRKPIESGTSPDLLATLRRRIRPLMLRRTKEAVADDLPPKIEQVVAVPLNTAHRRIYDTHLQRERQRILGLLDDVDRNRVAILSALTQLRQLSLDVHLVDPDAPASIHSSKVEALIEQLVEVVAEGHRCLVFSQFTRFLAIVRKRLDAEGIEHVYLDGRTRDRPKRIAEFTDGDAPVFLISLKAGGSGLTLTQADYVFVLDPWWNPAVEAQAVDRTHRIGQDKTVMVYRLVSENTIEEKVVALQERKRELFSRVIDEGGLMGAPLTADDIRGLLDG